MICIRGGIELKILRVRIEVDSSVKPRQIEPNVTRRGEISSPSITQFEFQPLAKRAAASLSSLKCPARKRTDVARGVVDIRHYRPMIYAFRDCISPFASPFVEIYYCARAHTRNSL